MENPPPPAEVVTELREMYADMLSTGYRGSFTHLEQAADLIEQLAAVIKQAPHGDGCGAGCQLTMCTLEHACVCWKSTAPATVLAQVKANAWDEGHRAGWDDRDSDAQAGWTPSGYANDTANPYRIEREAQS